ncbi:MAG: AAA family ATPase [Phycisphaerae bacterium]
MVKRTRVIVLNSDPDYAAELRSDLLNVAGVTIVAETDDPAHLGEVIEGFTSEVVMINLDTDPTGLLTLVKGLAAKYPNLSLFGISEKEDAQFILASIRAGMREFLVRPFDRQQLVESFDRVAQQNPEGVKQGRLICAVGSAGGSGCTTLATNLACELAAIGQKKVVLVDLDFLSGDVASLLGISPEFSIIDLCGSDEAIDQNMVQKALVKHSSGLFVLTSPNRFIKSHQLTLERGAMVINMLTDNFEYVICDGITRSDATNHILLDMTDTVLLVMQMVLNSVRNADRFMQKLASEGYNLDRVEPVINRYAKENSSLYPQDAEEKLGRPISWIIPSDWKTVSNAANVGQPFSIFNPKTEVSESIRNLALKIHDPKNFPKTGDKTNHGREKSGFWEKVLGK